MFFFVVFLHRPIVSLHKTSLYHQETGINFVLLIAFLTVKVPVATDLHFMNRHHDFN